MLVKLAAIFFSMILVNNYVLVKFYGIRCPMHIAPPCAMEMLNR